MQFTITPDRAVSLANGQLASPYVAYAETVSVQKQNHAEFESLLKQALAVDPDSRPEWRLSNIIMRIGVDEAVDIHRQRCYTVQNLIVMLDDCFKRLNNVLVYDQIRSLHDLMSIEELYKISNLLYNALKALRELW